VQHSPQAEWRAHLEVHLYFAPEKHELKTRNPGKRIAPSIFFEMAAWHFPSTASGLLLGVCCCTSLQHGLALPCSGASCAPADVKCAACEAMVEIANTEIEESEDSGKTVKAGWRLDSHGKRVYKEVPFAKSEEGIVKIFNAACHKLQNLTESSNGDGTKTLFVGPNEAFRIGGAKLDMYMRTCYDFIETFEEDIASTLTEWPKNDWPPLMRDLQPKICTDIGEVCPNNRWKHRGRKELRRLLAFFQRKTTGNTHGPF
jgi:hypothetical protein